MAVIGSGDYFMMIKDLHDQTEQKQVSKSITG